MKATSLGALGRQAERLFRVARGQAEPTQAPAEKFGAQPLAGQASDGTRFEVPGDGTPITLGSHPDRDVRLSDRFVSRRHAAVKLENGQLQVRDLGSSNGTFVDGHKLEPDQWVALPAGARLGLATGVPGQGVELSLGQSEARALPYQLLDNFGIGADHTILRRNLGSYLDRIAPEQRQLLVDQPNAKGLEQLFNQGFTAAEPEQFSAILKIQKALEEPYSNQDVGKRLDSLQDQAKARLRDYETQNGALPARIWLVGSAAKGTFGGHSDLDLVIDESRGPVPRTGQKGEVDLQPLLSSSGESRLEWFGQAVELNPAELLAGSVDLARTALA